MISAKLKYLKLLKDILPLPQFKILVIGESCKDVYHYGLVERISQEAPIPIFNKKSSTIKDGMSKNVCKNLESLGQKFDVITNNEDFSNTIRKERYIDETFNKQVFRADINDEVKELDTSILKNINYNSYDAIIISDYDKGFINKKHANIICKNSNIPIFVDSKKRDLSLFKNCFLKINELEYKNLSKKVDKNNLIITLGKRGALYKDNLYKPYESKVFDTCGAGDTFISSLCIAYLKTNSIENSVEFANLCAGISVKFLGNYSVKILDIYKELQINNNVNLLNLNNNLMKKVDKGWGYELWIHNDNKYCGKLLFFEKGKKCSMHYHKIKSETFYLYSGLLKCNFYNLGSKEDNREIIMKPGDMKEIPPNLVHKMEAIEESILFEFSTQHFDSDSYRIEKGD